MNPHKLANTIITIIVLITITVSCSSNSTNSIVDHNEIELYAVFESSFGRWGYIDKNGN